MIVTDVVWLATQERSATESNTSAMFSSPWTCLQGGTRSCRRNVPHGQSQVSLWWVTLLKFSTLQCVELLLFVVVWKMSKFTWNNCSEWSRRVIIFIGAKVSEWFTLSSLYHVLLGQNNLGQGSVV